MQTIYCVLLKPIFPIQSDGILDAICCRCPLFENTLQHKSTCSKKTRSHIEVASAEFQFTQIEAIITRSLYLWKFLLIWCIYLYRKSIY